MAGECPRRGAFHQHARRADPLSNVVCVVVLQINRWARTSVWTTATKVSWSSSHTFVLRRAVPCARGRRVLFWQAERRAASA